MRRRVRKRPSLLAPAGNLIRKLSNSDRRFRRRALRGSLWVLVVLFAWSVMFGTYSLPRIIRLELKKSALTESNHNLTAELVDAMRVREMLRTDRGYIEQIARTRYYMVRPGESVYRYRGR